MSAARWLVWISVAMLVACAGHPTPPKRAPITFEISWTDDGTGPHIQWEMADYDLNKVWVSFRQRRPPLSNLQGEVDVTPEYLENVRKVAREQHFFELGDIRPRVVEHLKHVNLKLTMDGRTHEVWVMDPESVAGGDEYRRFELVVSAILEPLPVGPGKTL